MNNFNINKPRVGASANDVRTKCYIMKLDGLRFVFKAPGCSLDTEGIRADTAVSIINSHLFQNCNVYSCLLRVL